MKARFGGEGRLIVRGLAVLFVVAAFFAASKVALWRSEVVHSERTSIHRVVPGDILLRFPQEPLNMADILTGGFLALAGAIAFGIAFGMGERLRTGRVTRTADAHSVRTFFAFAGAGLIFLGFDEVFLVHEFLSANLYIGDAYILLAYAAVGGVAAIAWQRVLRASGPALGVLVVGAMFHGAALGLDFVQDAIGWAPEEPLEMLGAGFYALAMATYGVRLVLLDALAPSAVFATGRRAAATASAAAVWELPDSAIQPLAPSEAPITGDPAWPRAQAWPSDPAWTH